MEAAIFETIPPSGDYEEYDFGDGAGERLWVKFTDDEAREWCGKFSFGWLGKKGKVALLPGGKAFVLADGLGYFIDIVARALLCVTEHDNLEDFIVIPGGSVLAATDGLRIILLDEAGETWVSDRVSVDGIVFESATPERIRGKYNDATPHFADFEFTLDDKVFHADWILKDHWPKS